MERPDISDKKAFWEWVKISAEEDQCEGWEEDYFRAIRMLEELAERDK